MTASKIEWTDRSDWNPIRGCTRVSRGCGGPGKAGGCYAERIAARFRDPGQPFHSFAKRVNGEARWTGKVALIEDRLTEPLRWRKPAKIFACSMSDLFHEALPDDAIDQVFAVMALCPQHTFQVLTKRPERMQAYIRGLDRRHTPDGNMRLSPAVALAAIAERHKMARKIEQLLAMTRMQWPLPNLWLGVSVEDQATADARIPVLLDTPAALRFISAEPLLGPVDLTAWMRRGIPGRRRSWAEFAWPTWVPERVRQQIEDFWRPEWGRGPADWIRAAFENGQPPLGTQGTFNRCAESEPLVSGRFVPAWNNIGRVVDHDGAVYVVSAGSYRSRPSYLDWVIAGGESGPGARPAHPAWFRSLRDQCAAAGVPFFFKQWGEWLLGEESERGTVHFQDGDSFEVVSDHTDIVLAAAEASTELEHIWREFWGRDGALLKRVGKRAAGALLDGRAHREFPR